LCHKSHASYFLIKNPAELSCQAAQKVPKWKKSGTNKRMARKLTHKESGCGKNASVNHLTFCQNGDKFHGIPRIVAGRCRIRFTFKF